MEGKKLRLVLDLKHVNKYLVVPRFKYENLKSLSEIFEQGYYFFTWDLKQGHHHISIFPEHTQYLGFSCSFQSRLRYFVFVVLPFGLADACFCFTKVIRTFIKRWRILCHNCFAYTDDGISGHREQKLAQSASKTQRSDLYNSGFIPNEDKCH